MNLWQQLKNLDHTAIGLSPMDGMTDAAFRFLIANYAKPDLIFTEFVNIDGLYFSREEVITPFIYHNCEKPIIAQIFGIDPKLFYLGAQIVAELGFDGVDINMGCPSKNVSSRGAGAGLIKTPALATEIIKATQAGINDWVNNGLSSEMSGRALKKLNGTKAVLDKLGTKYQKEKRVAIPVSVKTRLGYTTNEIETWLPVLLETNPANISLHGRTFKQLYTGQADWEAISKAQQIVEAHNAKLPIDKQTTFWGNGDVKSYEEAQEYGKKYNLNGILIGRAVLGDPWVMLPESKRPVTLTEKIPMILEHTKKHEELFPNGFHAMRKHLAWYIKGFAGASDMRQELVRSNNYNEVAEIILHSQSLTR